MSKKKKTKNNPAVSSPYQQPLWTGACGACGGKGQVVGDRGVQACNSCGGSGTAPVSTPNP